MCCVIIYKRNRDLFWGKRIAFVPQKKFVARLPFEVLKKRLVLCTHFVCSSERERRTLVSVHISRL